MTGFLKVDWAFVFLVFYSMVVGIIITQTMDYETLKGLTVEYPFNNCLEMRRWDVLAQSIFIGLGLFFYVLARTWTNMAEKLDMFDVICQTLWPSVTTIAMMMNGWFAIRRLWNPHKRIWQRKEEIICQSRAFRIGHTVMNSILIGILALVIACGVLVGVFYTLRIIAKYFIPGLFPWLGRMFVRIGQWIFTGLASGGRWCMANTVGHYRRWREARAEAATWTAAQKKKIKEWIRCSKCQANPANYIRLPFRHLFCRECKEQPYSPIPAVDVDGYVPGAAPGEEQCPLGVMVQIYPPA